MNDETPPAGRRDPLAAGRRVVGDAYSRADAILDRGQHRVFRLLWLFLPDTSVARKPRFQQIMASKFLSDAGQQALAFGALVAVVRGGGSALDAALIGVAALVPPALFGLYGGAVADALPQRVALAFVYNVQAALCFAVPLFLGTDLVQIMLLIFAVNVLGQVSGPTESAVIPVVASEEELASAASLTGLSSNLGTAFGTALLAPVLVRAFGVDTVFYVSGVLLLLAASRVFDLSTPDRSRRIDWRRPNVNVRRTVEWLIHERAVATMMVVAVLAGTANIVIQTLAPRYVSAVIGVDPANSVYVFAPSAVGLALALLAVPRLVRSFGERVVAISGFALVGASLTLLGFVDDGLASALDPVNPLRLLGVLNIDLSEKLRTAGFIAIALGFGLALTTTSVQTYLNRRVPLAYQGRAFALQSVLKNGTAIVPLLTLGGLATVVGVETVLIFAPIALVLVAFALVELSVIFGGGAPARRLDVLASFWEESDVPVRNPDEELADRIAAEAEAEAGDSREHQPA
jgi:MFS family permease